jgi:hypothetical protein
LAEQRGAEPIALANRPNLLPGLEVVWAAFWDLCGDRAIGFGAVGDIPFLAIDAWARRYGVPDADFGRLHSLVKAMDAAYRNWKPEAEKGEE